MKKLQSVLKKSKSIYEKGLEPFEVGKNNFEQPILCVEKKAEDRLEICKKCVNFVEEPIEFFRVEDKNIPELSNKMCNECGCTLSYKIRQDLKICKLW